MQKARESQTTVRAIQWTWSKIKGQKHPIKLVVTHQRQKKYYPIKFEGDNLFLTAKEWESIDGEKKNPRGRLRKIKEAIDTAKTSATAARNQVTANNVPFTFERFDLEYEVQESKSGFLVTFEKHLEALKSEKRIGTYRAYSNALAAFKAFRGGRDLAPIDLTPTLLKQFETYMLDVRNVGRNTVAMYARALRVVFNLCAESNPGLKEFYPFALRQNDRHRYRIRTAAGKKAEALEVEQLQAFIDTEPDKDSPEYEAKQLFLFSFYAQGMNMRDIANLKYQDIKGQTITYIREKTKRSESEETPLEIPLTEPLRRIIRAIGNPDKRPQSYVFGILQHGLTPLQQDSRIRDKIKKTNKALKSLCQAAGLPVISSYTARHSYATMLRDSGQSIETIKELLGHSDVRVTEAYLKRFDLKKKRDINERLQSLFKLQSA
ncbi:MAG: site-specific integrase [Cyclobacteriaceae bacterium]|nr:site-specific integrase [Cyclobacteriaceae bacterium]